MEIGVQISGKKSNEKNTPKFKDFGAHLGDHLGVGMRCYRPYFISVCCMLGPGKLDISKWVPKSTMLGPKIDDFCYIF